MPELKNRIVIDTNLWISFLLTKDFSKLDLIFKGDSVILLFSNDLLEEFTEVVDRPKFIRYFSRTDLRNLLLRIRDVAEFITISSDVEICRDPKDDFLFSLCKDGNATHLITGDKDLLIIGQFNNTRILTIRDYIAEL